MLMKVVVLTVEHGGSMVVLIVEGGREGQGDDFLFFSFYIFYK